MNTEPRKISAIAAEIRRAWHAEGPNTLAWRRRYFGAVPYLDAMDSLDKITDTYFCDTARSIVAYFLGNVRAWRSETARRIKAELKAMLK